MNTPAPTILDAAGRPFQKASYSGAGAGFGGQMRDWRPGLKSADASVLPALNLGNGRAEDLVRNNAIASGAVQLHVDNIVGHLFRLSYKPRYQRLGMKEEDARSFAKDVEAAWAEYAEDDSNCWLDVERKRTFTMMIRESVATHTRLGEAMGVPYWLDRYGASFKTAVKLLSPKRV